jgi:hypothetical protein
MWAWMDGPTRREFRYPRENAMIPIWPDPVEACDSKEQRLRLDEKTFRWMHNEDAMATEKLAEGIGKFNSDAQHLQ